MELGTGVEAGPQVASAELAEVRFELRRLIDLRTASHLTEDEERLWEELVARERELLRAVHHLKRPG